MQIIIFNCILACYGYCCAPCMICSNAKGLGEPDCLYCLLACCCPIVGVFLLRQKARERYGIEVSKELESFIKLNIMYI